MPDVTINLECGHSVPATPPGLGTGYAIMITPKTAPTGRMVDVGERACYECTDTMQRTDMTTATVFGVYLSSDGTKVTTWTGGKLGTVTWLGPVRYTPTGGEFHHINITAHDGSKWYGTAMGHGMCGTIRRNKIK